MIKLGLARWAVAALAATLAAPMAAHADEWQSRMGYEGKPVLGTDLASTFKCQNGGELTALFDTRDAQFVAIVDSGDGPHVLPLRPWNGEGPNVTWSDGRRTLVWTPGVHLVFTDGGRTQSGCSRDASHIHER